MEDVVARGRVAAGVRAGGAGSIGQDGGGGGVRAGDAGLNGQAGGRATGGRAGRRDAQGQSGGLTGCEETRGCGCVGAHLARLVGWTIGSR
jgi:hypothetical protein